MKSALECTGTTPPQYQGCYRNRLGDDRVDGHVDGRSISECNGISIALGKAFFGMEYPQGTVPPGKADCLPLTAIPSMVQGGDNECESESDEKGNRLGNSYRLAVYATTVETGQSFCVCTRYHYKIYGISSVV